MLRLPASRIPSLSDSSPESCSPPGDSLALKLTKYLEPGEYSIFLQLVDNQSKSQVTTVKASVCDCDGEARNCERRAAIAGGLGIPTILGILGGILALLSEYHGRSPLTPERSKEPPVPAKRVTVAKGLNLRLTATPLAAETTPQRALLPESSLAGAVHQRELLPLLSGLAWQCRLLAQIKAMLSLPLSSPAAAAAALREEEEGGEGALASPRGRHSRQHLSLRRGGRRGGRPGGWSSEAVALGRPRSRGRAAPLRAAGALR